MKQRGDLGVHILNGLLLSLICLQYFQELLVNLGLVLETVLRSTSADCACLGANLSYLDLIDI